MNKTNRALYLNALSQTGNHTDAYYYIEESLTANEANFLKAFIGWLSYINTGEGNGNKTPLGSVSITVKLHEFKTNVVKNRWPALHSRFDEMAKAEHEKVFAKADAFITDNLIPGKHIELHVVCYPLKNCTVVSYNPETKEVILKLN